MGLSLKEAVEEREKKWSTLLSTMSEESQVKNYDRSDLLLGFECSSGWIPHFVVPHRSEDWARAGQVHEGQDCITGHKARDLLIGCRSV